MKHCINIQSKDFKNLVEESDMHPMVLAAKMGVWMDRNNTQEWPSLDQIAEIGEKAVAPVEQKTLFGLDMKNEAAMQFHINTLSVVNDFLQSIGVEQRFVSEFLQENGSVVEGAIAAANFLNGTVDILDKEGSRQEAWNKLPEEAAHWWYRLLKGDTKLKSLLWNDTKVRERMQSMLGDSYETAYGPNNIDALTEEAIGQLIAEDIKRLEDKNNAPESYSFFTKFINWVNQTLSSFKKISNLNSFEVAAMKILNSDLSDLMTFEEYNDLNNKVIAFADTAEASSSRVIDYTLLEDLAHVTADENGFNLTEIGEDTGGFSEQNHFESQDEMDQYVLRSYGKILTDRQEERLIQVKDNEAFFEKLLNTKYKKKTKFLNKTLKKYYTIFQGNNIRTLQTWDIQAQVANITSKLTEEERRVLVATLGYSNITPTLKILPDMIAKYSKNPISMNSPVKIDGAKKQELEIINAVKDLIAKENPSKKSIKADELAAEIHNWLETNYLLGFANETAYIGYRIKDTFKYVDDSSPALSAAAAAVNLDTMAPEDIAALPLTVRRELAREHGIIDNPNVNVYHNKISLRFNDNYHNEHSHFNKTPSSWGNLTYFYSGKSKTKDAVLLHEIQNDNIERLRAKKVGADINLDESLAKYEVESNEIIEKNIHTLKDGGNDIIFSYDLGGSQFTGSLNEKFSRVKHAPTAEVAFSQFKDLVREELDLNPVYNAKMLYEAYKGALNSSYAKKRMWIDFVKKGGIMSMLTDQDKIDINDAFKQTEDLITSVSVGAEFLHDENQWEPGYDYERPATIDEKKKKFKDLTSGILNKIDAKLHDTYGLTMGGFQFVPQTLPLKKSLRGTEQHTDEFGIVSTRKKNSGQLNKSLKYTILRTEQGILTDISKNIYSQAMMNLSSLKAYNKSQFNEKINKISAIQFSKLFDNYKDNLDLLTSMVKDRANKELQEKAGIDTDNIEGLVAEQKSKLDSFIEKARARKLEVESNYGQLVQDAKKILEMEMNYFTPLVHHILQKHIAQSGKSFPMYFSGFNITMLTQGSNKTAAIYAGKEEVINRTPEEMDDVRKLVAQNLNLVTSSATKEEVDSKLDEYKKRGQYQADDYTSTMIEVNGGPWTPGPLYTAMSKIPGIKLEWQEHINGIIGNPGGYKVNLDNYNYTQPMLFGMQDKKFISLAENSKIYKDNNLLNKEGKIKYIDTSARANKWASELRQKADMKDYDFTVTTAWTNTKEGFKILISNKEVDKTGQKAIQFENVDEVGMKFESKSFDGKEIDENAPKTFETDEDADARELFTGLLNWGNNGLINVPNNVKTSVYTLARSLSARTGIKFQVITAEEAKRLDSNFGDTTRGMWDPNKKIAYLIDGRATNATAIHEIFGHPFLDYLKNSTEGRKVYDLIANEAILNDIVHQHILDNYDTSKMSDDQIMDEIIIRSLTDETGKLLSENVKDSYWKAFTNFLKKVFNIKNSDVVNIKSGTNLQQLAKWVVYGEGEMRLNDDAQFKDDVLSTLDLIHTEDTFKLFDKMYEGMSPEEFVSKLDISDKMRNYLADWIYENNPGSMFSLVSGITADINSTEKNVEQLGFIAYSREPRSVPATEVLSNIKDKIISGLKSRLKVLSRSGDLTKAELDEMQEMNTKIEAASDVKAAVMFIKEAKNEGESMHVELEQMAEEKDMNDVSASRLLSIYRDFLKMFDSVLNDIEQLNLREDAFEGLSTLEKDKFKQDLATTSTLFTSLNTRFEDVFQNKYYSILDNLAKRVGSTTASEMLDDIYSARKDVTAFSLWVGSPARSRMEQIRALDYVISSVHMDVARTVSASGHSGALIKLSKKFSVPGYKSFTAFMGRNSRGKYTGFLSHELDYGEFDGDYSEFRQKLADKYDLEDVNDSPTDPDQFKSFMKEKDSFLEGNVERRFVPEYYEARHLLSLESSEKLEAIGNVVRRIESKYTNEDGILEIHKMTPQDIKILNEAKSQKKQMGSLYHPSGEPKTGIEKEIAQEVKSFNDALKGKLQYKTNFAKFQAEKLKMISSMTPDEYSKWLRLNTRTQYKQEFWDNLAKVEKADQTPEWQAVYDSKQAILNYYRDPNTMEIDVVRMSEKRKSGQSARDKVDELDEILFKYRNEEISSKTGLQFSDVAKMVYSDIYKREYAKHKDMELLGTPAQQKIGADWFADNHGYSFDGHTLKPKSYWMKIAPKDESLIERETPNSLWSDLDEDSPYYNSKFRPELSEFGLQPKESVYDNRKAHEELISNPSRKAFYDRLLDIKRESNKLYNTPGRNPLLMPQMEGGSLRRIFRETNVGKGLWNVLKDAFRARVDEVEYGSKVDDITRPDNSVIKSVPKFFSERLKNPNTISKDIIHMYIMDYYSAVNYDRMNKSLPEIEMIREGIDRTAINGAKKGDTTVTNEQIRNKVAAKLTNASKRASEMIDRSVYGITSSRISVRLPWSNYTIDVAKPVKSMLSWFRAINLAYNPLAIAANYATAEINLTIESEIGMYMTRKDLSKAYWELIQRMPRYIFNTFGTRSGDKVTELARMFNISVNEAEDTEGIAGLSVLNFVKKHVVYGPYTAGDFLVKSKMLVAMMMGYKMHNGEFFNRNTFIARYYPGDINRKNANTMFDSLHDNLYDAFEMKKGTLTVKDEFKDSVTPELLNELGLLSTRLAARLDGVLVQSDRNAINVNAFASALMMHRGWLVGAVQDRLGGELYSYEQKMLIEGQYRSAVPQMFKTLLRALTLKPLLEKLHWAEVKDQASMTNGQYYNYKKTLNEIKYMLITAMLTKFLAPGSDPDDENNPKSVQYMLYVMGLRFLMEQNAVYSPQDLVAILKSPSAAQSQMTTLFDLSDGLLTGGNKQIVQRGKYQGLTKGRMRITKLIPAYKNIFENFISPDLKSKEKYIKGNAGYLYQAIDTGVDAYKYGTGFKMQKGKIKKRYDSPSSAPSVRPAYNPG